jgi:signal transduction histidine kinase
MRFSAAARPLTLVVLGTLALVSLARALGFGDGVVLGATPASGLALAAGVALRSRGAAAAGAGFFLAGTLWGLGPAAALADGLAHGAAALAGSALMRTLARRRAERSRVSDWLIFLAGVASFTAVVAAGLALAASAGALGPAAAPARLATTALVFEPLGLFTAGAALASLGEVARVRADPRPAYGIAALAVALLALLALLLEAPIGGLSPSGVVLALAIPFCLWIAMQKRSLDGAALSFLAAHLALIVLLARLGSVSDPDYVTAVVYLNLLVAVCQLVHAVNLDRLGALAEVEARKRDLEARVAERTARLVAMTERALAADAAKTRFLATVSHEVRTPLNGVLGMASVILADPGLDPKTRRYVEVIRTSGCHLLDVISRILDYAKLEGARGVEPPAEFDLEGVVDEVLAEARFLPYAAGLAFAVEIEPGLERRRSGSRRGLRQVLTNLVGNAAKFTDMGSVTVRLRAAGPGAVRIEVADTGVGVPAEEQARIFLPFEQADAAHDRRVGGTGLGLAICAEVVRRMGGRIGVESAPGAGALFWVEAPLAAAAAAEAAPPAAPAAVAPRRGRIRTA